MAVTVASIFRDSEDYLERYIAQISELEGHVGVTELVLAQGDSVDNTHTVLEEWLADRKARDRTRNDLLLRVDHGGPKFGSVDNSDRWHQIAMVCNQVMRFVPLNQPLIYVESDLIWAPQTMVRLLADLAEVDAVAPMSMFEGRFYDVWGHRGLDGERFSFQAPYHRDLETHDGPLIPISSAGSCIVMKPEVAERARWGEFDGMVGLGRSIRHDADAQLWLDRRVSVEHP